MASQNRTRVGPFFGQNVLPIGCASLYFTSVVIIKARAKSILTSKKLVTFTIHDLKY